MAPGSPIHCVTQTVKCLRQHKIYYNASCEMHSLFGNNSFQRVSLSDLTFIGVLLYNSLNLKYIYYINKLSIIISICPRVLGNIFPFDILLY